MTIPRPPRYWFASILVLLLLLFPASAQPPPHAPTILVLGDSLSAGFGMAAQQGWVALLGERVGDGYRQRLSVTIRPWW